MSKLTITENTQQLTLPTPETLDKRTSITHGEETIVVEPENVETITELGRGAYGIVEKVRHKPSGLEMAVKVIHR